MSVNLAKHFRLYKNYNWSLFLGLMYSVPATEGTVFAASSVSSSVNVFTLSIASWIQYKWGLIFHLNIVYQDVIKLWKNNRHTEYWTKILKQTLRPAFFPNSFLRTNCHFFSFTVMLLHLCPPFLPIMILPQLVYHLKTSLFFESAASIPARSKQEARRRLGVKKKP